MTDCTCCCVPWCRPMLTVEKDAAISYATEYSIPFGQPAFSFGCAIAHATDTPDFVVTQDGEYTIEYRLAADNPAVAAGLPIDQNIELVSAISGVLDTFHFTGKNQTYTKKLIVILQAGDRLFLRGKQPLAAEMHFSSLSLTITKMC